VVASPPAAQVRGYLPVDPSQKGASLMDTKAEEQEIALLTQRKQEMLFELQQYEQNNLHAARAKDRGDGEDTGAVRAPRSPLESWSRSHGSHGSQS
jgi:hypothetical protein